MGGDGTVDQRLHELFAGPAEVQAYGTLEGTTYRLPQYAPGNEHDIQAPYAPAWLGEPALTADVMTNVHSVFNATVNGLPGNDDLGGLSGWAVWSALGFGPAVPGSPMYAIGTPWFEHVTLHLARGDVRIDAPGASAASRYVQSARLDGRPLERAFFWDRELRGGLQLTLGPAPSAWGTTTRPPSLTGAGLAGFGC
jgi:putative alpha-1,2-mannosidase